MIQKILAISGWIFAILLLIMLSTIIAKGKLHTVGNYQASTDNEEIYMTMFPEGEVQIYSPDGSVIKKGTLNQSSNKIAYVDDVTIVSVDRDIATWINDKFYLFKKISDKAFLFSNN